MVYSGIANTAKNIAYTVIDFTVPRNAVVAAISAGAGWYAPRFVQMYGNVPKVISEFLYGPLQEQSWWTFMTSPAYIPKAVEEFTPYIVIGASVATSIPLNIISALFFERFSDTMETKVQRSKNIPYGTLVEIPNVDVDDEPTKEDIILALEKHPSTKSDVSDIELVKNGRYSLRLI